MDHDPTVVREGYQDKKFCVFVEKEEKTKNEINEKKLKQVQCFFFFLSFITCQQKRMMQEWDRELYMKWL